MGSLCMPWGLSGRRLRQMLSLIMAPETVVLLSAVPVLKHCFSAELRAWTGQKNWVEPHFFLEVAYPWHCFQPHQFNQGFGVFFPANTTSPSTQQYLSLGLLVLPSFSKHCCPQWPLLVPVFLSSVDSGVFSCDYTGVTTKTLISHWKSFQGISILFFPIKVLFFFMATLRIFSTHLMPQLVFSFSVCPTAHH